MSTSLLLQAGQYGLQLTPNMHAAQRQQPGNSIQHHHVLPLGLVGCMAGAAADVSCACHAEAAANKYIQERFVPKLVAAGIVVCVDIVRRPDEESPQGAAIVKKADEIDAACIVLCPHTQDFTEVCKRDAPMLAAWEHAQLHAAPLSAITSMKADAVSAAKLYAQPSSAVCPPSHCCC